MRRRRSAPGANLGNLAEADGPSLGRIYEGFLRVARSPLPTIAAVNGAAVGAGMNLALGCDVRLAGRRAKFDTRFLQIGLHPGGGHTWMLRRIAGPQAAMAAVVFGEVLDGAEAERVGLVHRCVDDDELLDAAHAMAARAATRAPRAGDRDQGDDPRRWPTSTTTPRRSSASSSRSCGAPDSRGSPNGSPRCRPGDLAKRLTGRSGYSARLTRRRDELRLACRIGEELHTRHRRLQSATRR